ncbi:hypothetical protein ACS0TY_034981 [Phlomoides rotata]
MGFSSKRWAGRVATVASCVYFFIIIVQVPLFRFPCRIGTCETPIDVMTCQLIVSKIFPEIVVKALLYPGAIKRYLMEGAAILTPNQLLNSYKFNMRKASVTTDIKQLEVIAGSYLCVMGAFLGLVGRGRMSVFGLTLILCGIVKAIFTGRHCGKSACIYPEMMITMVVAFFCMRRDVRKLIKCYKPD